MGWTRSPGAFKSGAGVLAKSSLTVRSLIASSSFSFSLASGLQSKTVEQRNLQTIETGRDVDRRELGNRLADDFA
jgi:hypothetical protein